MLKNVMMPIDGIMVPGLCPLYPIRPKDFLCPRVDETKFSMDGFNEDPTFPGTDEAPCGGVNPPIGDDAQDLPRVGNQEIGLTAETDTWTETYMPDADGMSEVPAMS